MSVRGQRVEVLGDGIDARAATKGSFALNLLRRGGAWEVRKGFGQLAEYDTSLSLNVSGQASEWGIYRHLGSYLMRTSWGHEQIVSVFFVLGHTCNLAERSQLLQLYSVSIYDVTTDDRWEEIVHRQTSEIDETTLPLTKQHGVYASNADDDYQRWVQANQPESVSFAELGDILYIGSPDLGLVAYVPCSFHGKARHRRAQMPLPDGQVDGVLGHDWARGYEESPRLIRVVASPNPAFSDAYTYLSQSEFPSPDVIYSAYGRMIYVEADARRVSFSDVGRPASIASGNYIEVPSERPLTAVAEHQGNLYFFSESEVFFYDPSVASFLLSQGSAPVRLSSEVGCLGPNAIARGTQALTWVDGRGAYTTGGNLYIQPISEDIDQLWRSAITDPLTSWYADNGSVDLVSYPDQPNSVLTFNPQDVHAIYHDILDALLISIPSEDLVLCRTEGQWSAWKTESIVYTAAGSPKVAAVRNLREPWLLSNGRRLFAVVRGSEVITDELARDSWTSRSYAICEYGRGGGTDRSKAGQHPEDYRRHTGKWKSFLSGTPKFYIGKPVQMPKRFALPNGNNPGEAALLLLPIYASPHLALLPITAFNLRFTIDSAEWGVVYNTASASPTTEIDVIFPPERWHSRTGYSHGAPDAANNSELQTYTSGAEVRIQFNGNCPAAVATPWAFQPNPNFARGHRNLLFWIPLYAKNVSAAYSSLSITPTQASFTGAVGANAEVFVWEEAHRTDSQDVEQAVDWCYRARPAALEQTRVKCRGTITRVISRGKADVRLHPGWPAGLYNTQIDTDQRGWSAQGIDYDGSQRSLRQVLDTETMRLRILDGAGALQKRAFGDVDWGEYVVDDEETSTVAVSDGAKGESFTVMAWGHIQNIAEWLRLESIEAVFMKAGARRRNR